MDERAFDELRRAKTPTLILDRRPEDSARVALLAGSFDPLTVGHAALAERAAERAGSVVLVYSVRTLPKEGDPGQPLLTERDRVAALARFCRSRPRHVVGLCSHGLLSDQVAAARGRWPRAHLSLVVGSDKLVQLFDPRWYVDRDAALESLFSEADVLYAVRERDEASVEATLDRPENRRWRDRFQRLAVPPFMASISSSFVRDGYRRGEDVRSLVPAEVRDFLPLPPAAGSRTTG
jgi:nicotinamide-nucleotide adenylyltransferase